MTDATTKRMMRLYSEERPVDSFFTSLYQTPTENYYNGESVEVDIERDGEDVAIPIIDGLGHQVITLEKYTNKSFVAPELGIMGPIRAKDLKSREPGQNPFSDPVYAAALSRRAMKLLRKEESMIRRNIELQCAQALQTGVVSLIDNAGNAKYSIDYGVKASHLITSGTAWDAGGNPLADLKAACNAIRNDSGFQPDMAIMGDGAFEALINNQSVKDRLDLEINIMNGGITGIASNGGTGGAQLRGMLNVDNFKVEIWTYSGRYKHQSTGDMTNYLDPAKVIVRASQGRLDLTFGGIPNLGSPNRVNIGLPTRLSGQMGGGNFDLHTVTYVDNSGETAYVKAGSRPLAIPTAIDTFATISTGV